MKNENTAGVPKVSAASPGLSYEQLQVKKKTINNSGGTARWNIDADVTAGSNRSYRLARATQLMGKKLKCRSLSETIFSKDDLCIPPIRKHEMKPNFHCKICAEDFTTVRDLGSHLKVHIEHGKVCPHVNSQKKKQCSPEAGSCRREIVSNNFTFKNPPSPMILSPNDGGGLMTNASETPDFKVSVFSVPAADHRQPASPNNSQDFQLKCSLCHLVLTNLEHAEAHARSHLLRIPAHPRCPVCSLQFVTVSQHLAHDCKLLRRPLRTQSYNSACFRCSMSCSTGSACLEPSCRNQKCQSCSTREDPNVPYNAMQVWTRHQISESARQTRSTTRVRVRNSTQEIPEFSRNSRLAKALSKKPEMGSNVLHVKPLVVSLSSSKASSPNNDNDDDDLNPTANKSTGCKVAEFSVPVPDHLHVGDPSNQDFQLQCGLCDLILMNIEHAEAHARSHTLRILVHTKCSVCSLEFGTTSQYFDHNCIVHHSVTTADYNNACVPYNGNVNPGSVRRKSHRRLPNRKCCSTLNLENPKEPGHALKVGSGPDIPADLALLTTPYIRLERIDKLHPQLESRQTRSFTRVRSGDLNPEPVRQRYNSAVTSTSVTISKREAPEVDAVSYDSCSLCGKTLKTRNYLKSHIRYHCRKNPNREHYLDRVAESGKSKAKRIHQQISTDLVPIKTPRNSPKRVHSKVNPRRRTTQTRSCTATSVSMIIPAARCYAAFPQIRIRALPPVPLQVPLQQRL